MFTCGIFLLLLPVGIKYIFLVARKYNVGSSENTLICQNYRLALVPSVANLALCDKLGRLAPV